MAYVANQQRKTFNEKKITGQTPITVATFQINKRNEGGGAYPYSLFKIQVNWNSGSFLVNSELYVNQIIITNNFDEDVIYYMPQGLEDNNIFPVNFTGPPPSSANQVKYSHLLFSDNPDVYDYFRIEFGNIITDPNDPDYYLVDVIATTPNFNNGDLMADSYCYILNTI